MQLESGGMAVAVTSSYSSDSAPILATSICPRCSHKKIKKKNPEKLIIKKLEQCWYILSAVLIFIITIGSSKKKWNCRHILESQRIFTE